MIDTPSLRCICANVQASKPSEGSAGWAYGYALINAGKPHQGCVMTNKASDLLVCIAWLLSDNDTSISTEEV
jgi:hypothetical protein